MLIVVEKDTQTLLVFEAGVKEMSEYISEYM